MAPRLRDARPLRRSPLTPPEPGWPTAAALAAVGLLSAINPYWYR
jgi:hypothetical protein